MAGEFHPMQMIHYPKLPPQKENKEKSYWDSFEFPTIIKEFSAINYVDISPVAPFNFLVTSNAKAQIIAPYTHEIKRTAQLKKEHVFGARYRRDGSLMALGSSGGLVQILNITGKSVLRNLEGHSSSTRVCSFGRHNSKLFTGSDDKTLRQWDIPTGKSTQTLKGHEDHIRCGCITTESEQFVTGSYDHTVKVWDFRSSECAFTFDHGAPVECVLVHSNGMMCYSAGSNYIKVWDLLGGGKLLAEIVNHQKNIMTMCFNQNYTRLLSGSLDRHVKIYDVTDDYTMSAHLRYPSPILAMGLSKNDDHLVVGMSDGAISIRNRTKPKSELDEVPVAKKRIQVGDHHFYIPEEDLKEKKGDLVVQYHKLFVGETLIDKLIRKYQFSEALDYALKRHAREPERVVSVVSELAKHNVWEKTLKGRDARTLEPILTFLTKHVGHPLHGKVLIPFSEYVIEKYTHLLTKSPKYLGLVRALSDKVKSDLATHLELMKTMGALEQVLAMSTQANTYPAKPLNVHRVTGNGGSGAGNNTDNDVMMNDVTAELMSDSFLEIRDTGSMKPPRRGKGNSGVQFQAENPFGNVNGNSPTRVTIEQSDTESVDFNITGAQKEILIT